MLEAKQGCKDDAPKEHSRLPSGVSQRQNQEAIHEAIVLEVDVVDHKERWR